MSLEIEIRTISALLQIGDKQDLRVQKAMLVLTPIHFGDAGTKHIFQLIVKYYKADTLFGGVELAPAVKSDYVDFFYSIVAEFSTGNLLENDVVTLCERYKRSQIQVNLQYVVDKMKSEPIHAEATQYGVEGCLAIGRMATVNENKVFTSEQLADKFLSGEAMESQTIPTGIKMLDDYNAGGFRNKSLVTIAGRPSTGKTGFAVHIAQRLAANHDNKHVLFYSLEMSANEIYEKQLTAIASYHPNELTPEQISLVIGKSLEVPFTIDETSLASIDYIETTARITHATKPVGVVVVDYLSIVQNKTKFESNALRQADITGRLAALSKELDCIVIALSQVNRDYAQRQDKCPVMSDAADSSGSERNSAYWLGIHRPALDDNDLNMQNVFTVKCRKSRWVDKLWTIHFGFDKATFTEVDQNLFHEIKTPKKKTYQKKDNLNDIAGDF